MRPPVWLGIRLPLL